MSCALTSNRTAAGSCGGTKAGLDELKNWFIDRDKITFGAVNATTGVISTFTIETGAQLWPWAFETRGFSFGQELTVNAQTGAATFKPTLTGRFANLSGKSRADGAKLLGTNLVAITMTKEGKFLVNGRTAGLSLQGDVAGSAADALGHVLTISTSEENDESESYAELLQTDQATTLAALIAAEEVAD